MSLTREVAPGVHEVPLGTANAFLLEDRGAVVVIDTGSFGSGQRLLAAVGEIGRRPRDVRAILVSHCHADHAGSLAVVREVTGAPAQMHRADAELVRRGQAMRPAKPSPSLLGLLTRLGQPLRRGHFERVPPAIVDTEMEDGYELPFLGGIRAVATPGHTAGHLSFLWPAGGVLIAGDACANVGGLGLSALYEDLEEGRRSLAHLAELDFEFACFGHGGSIKAGASERFRRKWGKQN